MTSALVTFILRCALLFLYHPLDVTGPKIGDSYSHVAGFSTRTRNNEVKWHGCAGTLISARYILTTEKCSNVLPGETLLANFRFPCGKKVHMKEIPISMTTYYSEWFKDKYGKSALRNETFNVAILTLSESYDGAVPAEPVFTHQVKLKAKHYAFTGWGSLLDFSYPIGFPRDPRKVYLSILSREECERQAQESLPNFEDGDRQRVEFTLPAELLCARTDNKVSLMAGDLGGPVFDPYKLHRCTKQVVGIVLQTAFPSYNPGSELILVLPFGAVKDFIQSFILGV